MAGGTGLAFDWSIISRLNLRLPLILAGGIGPDNVREAINRVHPFGIDVNSGVERVPGQKDAVKLHSLMELVRLTDQQERLEGSPR
jgi:phosphoribosylanthranilate isomerase